MYNVAFRTFGSAELVGHGLTNEAKRQLVKFSDSIFIYGHCGSSVKLDYYFSLLTVNTVNNRAEHGY